MRISIALFFFAWNVDNTLAQTNTDVFLFDLTYINDSWQLSNQQNISQNKGYDNQPNFSPDGEILYYTSNRNGETDLIAYEISTKEKTWITSTKNRSEYSPTITPDDKHISFITLAKNGTQDFRKINLSTGEEEIIESSPIIGYFVWVDEYSYLCFVLSIEDQPPTLEFHHLQKKENIVVGINPGRSFHQIPSTNTFSFLDFNQDNVKIMAFDPKTDSTAFISNMLDGSEDIAWHPNGTVFTGVESELFILDTNNNWKIIESIEKPTLHNITRLAINSSGTKIAVIGSELK